MKRLFNLAMAFVATMILASSCNNEPVNEPVNEPEQDGTINFTATQFSGDHMSLGKSGMYMVMLLNDDETISYMFILYNQLGEVDENGNVTIPSGTYTCPGTTDDYTISPYSVYMDKSGGAENMKTAEFTEPVVVVSENKIVLTTIIEGVTHVVTYNGALSMPADLPEPDVNFEAKYAYAYYTKSTSDDGVAKFKLFLSDIGRDENGNVRPNGTYYRLTLSVDELDPKAECAIPAGRYEVDETSTAAGFITDAVYYKFGDAVSDVVDDDFIDSGYLTVKEDGSIEASFDMFFSGATHNITFSGKVEMLDSTMLSEPPYSTLKSDKDCDLSNHSLSIWSNGDVYNVGYHSWTVSITPENSVGDNLMIEILRGADENADISGKYTISNSMEDYTIVPGYVDGFTLMSSWYYYEASALNITNIAPIDGGWIEIQAGDNDVYTITFELSDDKGNKIVGTYSNVEPASLSAVSHPAISL